MCCLRGCPSQTTIGKLVSDKQEGSPMVENHQDIIQKKIETHLEYFLSTSDDAQKQIQYLLSADLGGGNSTYLLDILVGVCKPPLAYLDRMNSHGKSLLRPLLDVFFSFENIMRLANDESIKESEMFEVLLSKMSYYYLRHDMREETPNIRFDPWPWLDYLLNDSDKEAELILSFDEWDAVGYLKMSSIDILLYASMYCYSDKEKDKFTQYFDLYEAEYGISRRLGQCRRILEGRLDGQSLIESDGPWSGY